MLTHCLQGQGPPGQQQYGAPPPGGQYGGQQQVSMSTTEILCSAIVDVILGTAWRRQRLPSALAGMHPGEESSELLPTWIARH